MQYHPLYLQWLLRRRRLRRLLRPLPRRGNLSRYPVLKWFAASARRAPYLWSFKRGQVLPALYAGSVLAFLPVFGVQIVLALALAMALRANLTVLVGLQMIVNPLTLAPIYGFTTWVGLGLMARLDAGQDWAGGLQVATALVLGGCAVGLLFALGADLLWRFLAWEAGQFREKLRAVRAQQTAAGQPAAS